MAKSKQAVKSKSAKKDNKKPAKKPEVKAKKAASAPKAKPVAKKVDLKPLKDKKIAVVSKGKKPADTKAVVVNNAKANSVVVTKPVVKPVAKTPKVDAKAKNKGKKVEKKEEDFEDDIVGDEFGESEIAEYEEDLKAVEEEDIDINDLEIEDTETEEKDEEIYLTDSEGRRLCKVRDCDQAATVEEYCRYHYLLLWKKIQVRKSILHEGKLEKYVEDLTSRYPDKFLEVIRKDLKTEKDFLSVVQDLELDENALAEVDGEDEVQSFADEIRGIGETTGMDEDGDF